MGAIVDGREHRIRVPRVTATSGIDLSTAKLWGSGTHSVNGQVAGLWHTFRDSGVARVANEIRVPGVIMT